MNRSDYFYRTVVFAKQGNDVFLVDLNSPKEETTPLDPWLGLAVSLADGQHTIQEFQDYLIRHYQGQAPANLDKTIDSVLQRLVVADMIRVSDDPTQLPYYLSMSADKLDVDMARQGMADDGFEHRNFDGFK